MWTSRSTPSSAAPSTTSSRLTARANALSFIFFRTDLASTSCTLRGGRRRAVGELVDGEQRLRHARLAGHVAIRGVAEDGAEHVVGPAPGSQYSHAVRRVLL